MTSVEDRMSRLERELREVRDALEIYQRTASYGPLVDLGDSQGASALWTFDGAYDWGRGMTEGSPSVAVGRKALAAIFDGAEHRAIIANGAAHWLSLPHVSIDGDQATSLCYSGLFMRDAAGFKVTRVSICRFTWVRTGEGWKIQNRQNRLLNGDGSAIALLREFQQPEASMT